MHNNYYNLKPGTITVYSLRRFRLHAVLLRPFCTLTTEYCSVRQT